jgi:hypothetical protein
MDMELGHPTAGRKHIKTLLKRRDHLKKVAFDRILQGQAVDFQLGEISAINSVLNELLALRGYQPVSSVDEDPVEEESDRYAIELDTLSAEEAMAMVLAPKDYPIQASHGKRIRFLPTAEVRIARTTSHKMDIVNIALWKSIGKTEEWQSVGGFRIPVEAFSALVQELNNLEIDKLTTDQPDFG